MALAPCGMLPISKVHRIPQGGRRPHVGNAIRLIDVSDKVIHNATLRDSVPAPPDPTNDDGQTIFYLFKSIEPASFNTSSSTMWPPRMQAVGPLECC